MIKKIIDSLEHVPPKVLKKVLKNCLWEGTEDSGAMALTFDDGPDPDVTPLILDVLDELGGLIGNNLSKKGPGVFNVPGLMKVKVVRKEATPEREGINPFTKEPTIFKAKPARNVVKILPLKGLKDMV